MKNFKIGDKLTRFPLIQGGMGVGISLGRLAGTVAKEGGIGIISTAQIGYREKDFDRNTEEANQRAILSEMKKARRISPDGIIGYNIMVALKEYASHVKAAVHAGADLIISGAGLPTELPALVSGSKTKIAPIVSTDKSAKVILKYWERKYKRTADLVVIEGPQAGGHLGFHKEELDSYTPEAYDNEIRKIVQTVKSYAAKFGTEIPVVAAGGIATHEDVKHVLDLGVDGVQVATRFIPTEECDADIRLKESLIHAAKDDIAIVKRYSNYPESGRYAGTCHYESLHAARHGRRKDPAQSLPPLPCQMFPRRDPLLHYRQADRRRKGRRGKRPAVLRSKGLYGR